MIKRSKNNYCHLEWRYILHMSLINHHSHFKCHSSGHVLKCKGQNVMFRIFSVNPNIWRQSFTVISSWKNYVIKYHIIQDFDISSIHSWALLPLPLWLKKQSTNTFSCHPIPIIMAEWHGQGSAKASPTPPNSDVYHNIVMIWWCFNTTKNPVTMAVRVSSWLQGQGWLV